MIGQKFEKWARNPGCSKFLKMNMGASSVFVAIPFLFLKYACLPVERDGKFISVNMLVNIWLGRFRVMLSDLHFKPKCLDAPARDYSQAEPPSKEGAAFDPGVITGSGMMYRIFTNVLLVTVHSGK